jgi:hypothetical protein
MGRNAEQPAYLLPAPPGLCGSCKNRQLTPNDRGRLFLLCGGHAKDSRLPKYPLLPVFACHGYQPLEIDIDEEP